MSNVYILRNCLKRLRKNEIIIKVERPHHILLLEMITVELELDDMNINPVENRIRSVSDMKDSL